MKRAYWELIVCVFLSPAAAWADVQIIDSGRMFRPADVQSVERSFWEFEQRTNVAIVLETVSNLRGLDSKLPAKLPPSETDRILTKACDTRAEKRNLHGIYILICRDPLVVKCTSLRNQVAPEDCKGLVEVVTTAASTGKTDSLLSKASEYLKEVQPRPTSVAVVEKPPPPESSGYFWPAALLIGAAVIGGGAYVGARSMGKTDSQKRNDAKSIEGPDDEQSPDGRWNIGSLPRD